MTTAPRALIGIGGYAESGKSVAADVLWQRGWIRREMADPIRAFAWELNALLWVEDRPWWAPWRGRVEWRVRDAVDALGWQEAKKIPEMREHLQHLGSAGRDAIGLDVWLRAALRCVPTDRIVVAGVRHLNEVDAIRDAGGFTVRIHRPGWGPLNAHETETAAEAPELWDHVVVNDGTVADLRRQVLAIARLRFGDDA